MPSSAIKASKGYAKAMRDVLARIQGKWSSGQYKSFSGVTFSNGEDPDLSTSIHDGEILGKGEVCKNRETQTVRYVKLDILVKDDYDFHTHWIKEYFSDGSLFAWAGNNFVWFFGQTLGWVHNYRSNIYFHETRTSF